MSVEIKADIRHWLRELDKKYFFVMLGFAVMVYFPLISQRLVNTFDGLWNGSWFIGGFWELSIGRWLWCVADAVRFGVQTEPLNALLTLSMMVLGITLLRRLFVERDNALTYFAGMAAISGAAVGVQLSYRYMSPIFGLSFLFAVLAAYWVITTTHAGAAVGCGAVILALSLGLYQANLAVFCMILLAYLLRLLFQNAEPQKTGVHIAKSLGSAAAGMVLYWLVLKLVLALCRIDLTSYNGAAEISVKSILFGLPNGILQAYRIFGIYFFRNAYRHNTLQPFGLFAAVLAMLAVWFLCRFVRMARSGKTGGLLLGTAALLALSLAFLVVYGNVYMMAVDQEAMRQGRDSLRVMSDRIVNDLTEEGCFDEGNHWSVMIAGRPSSNPTFKKGDLYPSANRYAQMGCFWLSPECARLSWRGVFEKITPVEITLCEDEDYQKLRQTELVAEMPVYPQEGYIQQVGDIVIVKVSEDYLIDE